MHLAGESYRAPLYPPSNTIQWGIKKLKYLKTCLSFCTGTQSHTTDNGLSVPAGDGWPAQVHKQCTAEPFSASIGCWTVGDLRCQMSLCGPVMCGYFATQSVLLHWLNYFSYLGYQTTRPSHWFIAQGWGKKNADLFSLVLFPYHCNQMNILFLHLQETKAFAFHTNLEKRSWLCKVWKSFIQL